MQDYHFGRDRWYKADEVDAELDVLKTELGKLSKQLTEELAQNKELDKLNKQLTEELAQNKELDAKLAQANAVIVKVKEALGNASTCLEQFKE